jgi:DNA primase catalytic core
MTITSEIYKRLDRAQVLADLKPIDKGDRLKLTCPFCGKKEAYIYKNGSTIICNRLNKCGYSVTIFDYVEKSKNYTTSREVTKELARMANYPFPANFNEDEYTEKRRRETALESVLTFFKKELFKNKTALKYLTNKRGYSEKEINVMDLGLIPSFQELNNYLVNNDYLVNIESIFADRRLEGRVAIPYRDYVGRLQGFNCRALDKSELKYLNTKGLKPSLQLFNMDKNRGEGRLVLTEGYLDPLIATAKGLKGFVGVGKAYLSDSQLENAIKHGAKHFILALDADKAGAVGIRKAIEEINRQKANAYVLSLPKGYKDIDEYLRKHSPDELNEIIKEAQSAGRWVANDLLSKHSKLTDMEKREIINEALAYGESLSNPLDSKDFIDVISQGLNIPLDLLEPLFKDYNEKKAKERQKKSFKELHIDADRLLNEGKLEELNKLYREKLPSIMAKGVVQAIEPYFLPNFMQDIQTKKEGLSTGFANLDYWITIPQEAITIIAGRPSHGKTTLLLNMFLNSIRTHEDKRFFFFSYEETKNQLALKCLTILSGAELHQYKNLEHIEAYLKNNRTDKEEINKAKSLYQELTDSSRLWLIEEPYYIDDLTDSIIHLADKYNNIGAIFIDYIQKIKIKGKYQSRQVEIQKVSEAILEAAKKAHLPIILGAQLNREGGDSKRVRLSNLRESGDIEQDANLVLGLYNEDMQEMQESESLKYSKKIEIDLKVTILKNRGGITGIERNLTFNKPTLTLTSTENNT